MFGIAHVLCIWCVPLEQNQKLLALAGAVPSSHAGTLPQGGGIPEGIYGLVHLQSCHWLLCHTQLVPALFPNWDRWLFSHCPYTSPLSSHPSL